MRRRPWAAVVAWGLWLLTLLTLAATLWLDRLLIEAGLPDLAFLLDGGNLTVGMAAVSAATVGGPGGQPPAGTPGGLAAGRPRGGHRHRPSPRWRWWARVTAAGLATAFLSSLLHPRPLYPEYPEIGNPIGVAALEDGPPAVALPAGALLILAGLVVGAVSLLLRFRRARGIERLQLRWLAVGAVAAVALLVSLTALVVETDGTVFQAALGICVAVFPLATGAAILRYRLYDLDRIISRTLAYGLLTVLLGLGYAAAVLGLGQLLPNDDSLVVAAATLAVAALFQPVRRRLQQATDRRFNRRRYHAASTIQAFSARLREEVDLDTLTAELLTVVDQTVQPTTASLWLRRAPEA
jgi:hypothetical protein